VPNLNAGRGFWVAGFGECLNVRRLMYQTLIWPAVLGDEAGCLRAALDAERVKRLADALVDRVGGDVELAGDLFRRQVLVDEAQAIELALCQLGNLRPDRVLWRRRPLIHGLLDAEIIVQNNSHPARHRRPPEQRVLPCLGHLSAFRQISGHSSCFGGNVTEK
jgi:hypothetical protein